MALPGRDFKIQTEINPNFKIASIIGFNDLRLQAVYAGAPNQSQKYFCCQIVHYLQGIKMLLRQADI